MHLGAQPAHTACSSTMLAIPICILTTARPYNPLRYKTMQCHDCQASATAFGCFICIWGFQSLVFFGLDHDVLGTALGQCLDFLDGTMMF